MQGLSKADFIAKLGISLKEASETEYWLELLFKTDYIILEQYQKVNDICHEVIKLLTAIIKTSKEKIK